MGLDANSTNYITMSLCLHVCSWKLQWIQPAWVAATQGVLWPLLGQKPNVFHGHSLHFLWFSSWENPRPKKWTQRPKKSIPYAPIIFQNKILEINHCWPGLVNDHRLPCVGRPAVVLGPSTARRNVCRQNSPASFTNQIMWWENIGRTYVLCPQQPAWERPRGCVHCAYCRPCF